MNGRKVLIVDDERLILLTARMVLESVGHTVYLAANGEDGIEAARRECPDVILLDIMLPGIDGWETLSRLKLDSDTRDIPVVVFTAREHLRGRSRARQMGAADYYMKPFDADELIELVECQDDGSRTHRHVPSWS